MKIVNRRAISALFGAVLVAGVAGVGTPALAAGTPPSGSFTLVGDSLWTGQQATVTQQSISDDDTPVEEISRVIIWGDGVTTTAAVGETTWTHTYTAPGSFLVEVVLSDGEVSDPVSVTPQSVVVVNAPGTLGWQNNKVWTTSDGAGGTYLTEAVFTPKGMSTAADEAWTTWGDGEFSLLRQGASSTTVPHYFEDGVWTPEVQFQNARGKATPRKASPLTVGVDNTKPTSGFTFPANAGRGSSWKAFKGTGRDSQSGADMAEVVAFKYNASTDYYYNFSTKKWIKITDYDADLPDAAFGASAVSSTGTWSVPTSGVTKGYHLEIHYWVYDKVGNYSADKWATAFISS